MTPTAHTLMPGAPPVTAGAALHPVMAQRQVGPCSSGPHRMTSRQSAAGTERTIDAGVRARFGDGDPDAVRAVYRAYGRLVYAVAYKVLGDRGLSEEATQQTFLKAWRSSRSVDPGRELGPWLATIARRVAIDLYRREVRRSTVPLDAVAPDAPALVSTPSTVEEACDIWDVRRAVSALPADDQQIVRMQHFEGFTHAQIAQRLGVPVGTVKSRSFRAHKRLATDLEHLRQ
jgi:RNA polymerase sigma factor (sigma-70 family)